MQLPWQKSRDIQLDLLDQQAGPSSVPRFAPSRRRVPVPMSASDLAPTAPVLPLPELTSPSPAAVRVADGRPLNLAISLLQEDANNPRTEFSEVALESLVQDILERGILQPIVVQPADAAGRYRIHFGALRLRAAQQAGLHEVPVVVRDAAPVPYAQVAENLMRRALSRLEIARFIKGRVDAGESNVTIAKRIGMNLTSVAHHLTLLELPPEPDQAMQAGRCTTPRTLHELDRLHDDAPETVKALVDGLERAQRGQAISAALLGRALFDPFFPRLLANKGRIRPIADELAQFFGLLAGRAQSDLRRGAQADRVALAGDAVVESPAVRAALDEQLEVQARAIAEAIAGVAGLHRLDRGVRCDKVRVGHAVTPKRPRLEFCSSCVFTAIRTRKTQDFLVRICTKRKL